MGEKKKKLSGFLKRETELSPAILFLDVYPKESKDGLRPMLVC